MRMRALTGVLLSATAAGSAHASNEFVRFVQTGTIGQFGTNTEDPLGLVGADLTFMIEFPTGGLYESVPINFTSNVFGVAASSFSVELDAGPDSALTGSAEFADDYEIFFMPLRVSSGLPFARIGSSPGDGIDITLPNGATGFIPTIYTPAEGSDDAALGGVVEADDFFVTMDADSILPLPFEQGQVFPVYSWENRSLEITVVPPPAGLIALGASGLLAARRRR